MKKSLMAEEERNLLMTKSLKGLMYLAVMIYTNSSIQLELI